MLHFGRGVANNRSGYEKLMLRTESSFNESSVPRRSATEAGQLWVQAGPFVAVQSAGARDDERVIGQKLPAILALRGLPQ